MIFIDLFLTFLKIGAFTFGGGYAMIPLIQSEVLSKGWMSSGELVNFIAVSESTPGPFAINISTYIGAEMAGIFGSLCATLGVVIPSFVIILLVAKFIDTFQKSSFVKGVMSGLRPAVIGLIAAAVISIGKTVFFPQDVSFNIIKSYAFISSTVIFAIMLLFQHKKLHPIIIICLSATLGVAAGYIGIFTGIE